MGDFLDEGLSLISRDDEYWSCDATQQSTNMDATLQLESFTGVGPFSSTA
ncbi:hypothetical protein [Brevibacillus formosus]|nr:hypothetical protein [Brevibacillus formosus]